MTNLISQILIENVIFNQRLKRWINLVKIYLQLIFVLDLVEYGTNRIQDNIWNAKRDLFLNSKYEWPKAQLTK